MNTLTPKGHVSSKCPRVFRMQILRSFLRASWHYGSLETHTEEKWWMLEHGPTLGWINYRIPVCVSQCFGLHPFYFSLQIRAAMHRPQSKNTLGDKAVFYVSS